MLQACRHGYAEQVEDGVLNELLALLREVGGRVLAHADHHHRLGQHRAVAIRACRQFRHGDVTGERDRRRQGLDAAFGCLKTPLGDSRHGVCVALREERQLTVRHAQSAKKRVCLVRHADAQVLRVHRRSPVPHVRFEQKGLSADREIRELIFEKAE